MEGGEEGAEGGLPPWSRAALLWLRGQGGGAALGLDHFVFRYVEAGPHHPLIEAEGSRLGFSGIYLTIPPFHGTTKRPFLSH